jgi:hypothetical protein
MFRIFRPLLFVGLALCSVSSPPGAYGADLKSVPVLDAKIGGHIHPSICRTKDGTLVVVYRGTNVLMCSRSTDGGATWSKAEPIATSAKRPDSIRAMTAAFEVYPGTADVLPDGRILVTWNFIGDDKKKDNYYERALLYSLSSDNGATWSEQTLIRLADGAHLGAVRHNVLPMPDGRWLLPLRVGPPRLYDPKTGALEVFPVAAPGMKQYAFKQIVRTPKGSLIAMGPVLLRSTDVGKTWTSIENFPAKPEGDTEEGRYLTVVDDGRLLVSWGIGNDNKGVRYNFSADDGLTWNPEPLVVLPEVSAIARYYSPRTVQVDANHVGTVFMNRNGVHFVKVPLDVVAK